MTSLAIALIAVAAGLALVAAGIELFDRELDRRARRRVERQQRAERLMWQRLDWVTGPSATPEPASGPPGEPSVESRPAGQSVETRPVPPGGNRPRATATRAPIRDPGSGPAFESPRRLLWRDTLAVLFVGVLAGFLYSTFAAPPGAGPAGGVLGATSAPASPSRSASPSASPAATPRPTQGAGSGTEKNLSPTPARTARPASTVSPSP